MEEAIEKRILPKCVFPALLLRHRQQCEKIPSSKLLFHQQAHEAYMYTFFKYTPLNSVSNVVIDKIEGQIKGATDISTFCLEEEIDEERFYEILKYSPAPFVFIPNCRIIELENFCIGAHRIKTEGKEGILMDLKFAVRVGLGFIGGDLLLRPGITTYYIGLIYDTIL